MAASATAEPTTDRSVQDKIIRRNVLYAMGVGAVPIPFLDMAALVAIQATMVKKIADQYDIPYKEHGVKSSITALLGTLGAHSLATGTLGSMVKLIPYVGGIVGAVTYPIFAGASTYAVGKVFVQHFESGGTFVNFNPKDAKDYFAEEFKKGKEVAEDAKDEASTTKKTTTAAKKP